jgi:hypothetical protein
MDGLTNISATYGHDEAGAPPADAGRAPRAGDGRDVFRREGEYWVVRFDGRACNLRHSVGLGYIAELLRRPGREIHALALLAALDDAPARGPRRTDQECDALVDAERARLSVTRAIRRAQARVAAYDAALGEHFAATLHTGRYCAYVPDSRVRAAWDVD